MFTLVRDSSKAFLDITDPQLLECMTVSIYDFLALTFGATSSVFLEFNTKMHIIVRYVSLDKVLTVLTL